MSSLLILVFTMQVEKELGERRLIGYHGVGLAVAPKLNFEELTAGTTSKEEVSAKELSARVTDSL